ncbi:ATP-binding protein [Staphylothermus hellenicus]|uniref:ATPase (AAA+ superfamily)-like protein n=1 Tax=Staphylothermus hellenicus (strain DSM 12710 / JCM 10830 / BK20S6-10-b1 / P8) TaxID=591019 RepID=D7DAZ4_STAHD|nr:ATP-binding protein [Staphylothermus hellenicus]ADI31341.1 protein of unknown function DUF499 [Staphylothermus hellenicus DSM 12710]
MGFKQHVSVREDVLDPSFDEKLAPEIYEVVYGTAPRIYMDPREFFERTYLTDSMKTILSEIGNTLTEGKGRKVYPIIAFFGGGKTHTLLTIYHAVLNPSYTYLLSDEVYKLYRNVKGVEVVVIYGKDSRLAPSPIKPLEGGSRKIKTLWGYLADRLKRYELVERDDKNETCPDQSVLKKLLQGRKVVILVDEILDYIDSILSSKYKNKEGYVSEVVRFFDRLAQAVESTNNVLVITIAAEKKPGGIEPQPRYKRISEFVRDLLDALLRVAGNVYAPISRSTELFNVVKKRLFSEVRVDEAKNEIRKLISTYNEFKEVFGDTSKLREDIKKTYPFHPSYISVLREIAERVTGNRTRFLMRISRLLLRKLLRSNEDPVLIMPWHIDPVELGVEGLFFMGDYSDYQRIYADEIVALDNKIPKESERKNLIKIILRTIFLSTYPYDSLKAEPVFPTSKEIVQMVYEPKFFESNRYKPVDIVDALSEIKISNYTVFLHYDESTDRYWYSRIASIKEWIRREAKKILEENRSHVENLLMENIHKLMTSRLIEVGRAREASVYSMERFRYAEIFDAKNISVYRYASEAEVPDSSSYKLVAILYNKPKEIEELIYKFRGIERTHANTVVAVTISTKDKLESLLEYQALLRAAEIIMDRINELYSGYAKEIKDIERSIASYQKRMIENILLTNILNFFDQIYYPAVKDSRRIVEKTYATSSDKSISEKVVSALSSPSIGKIVRSLNFESLKTYLSKVEIEIKPGRKISVGDVINVFKTRPELPMVREDRIKDAIKEGVLNLEIALIDEFNRRYFKRIYSPNDITSFTDKDRGEEPTRIQESFIIMHWRDALKEILEEIKSDIEENDGTRIDNGILKLNYYVVYRNKRYSIKDIEKFPDWEIILRDGFIVKEEKILKTGINLVVEPSYIEISPDESVDVRIEAQPLGDYGGNVKITVSSDAVTDHGVLEGQVPFKTWIKINGSRIRQQTLITIRAIDDNGNSYEEIITVKPKTSVIDIHEPGVLEEGDVLISIKSSISNKNYRDILELINKLTELLSKPDEKVFIVNKMELHVKSREYGVSDVLFKQADPAIVYDVVSELLESMGSNIFVEGSFEAEFPKEITINSTLKRILDKYIRYADIIVTIVRRK